jgi:hypothetical protein
MNATSEYHRLRSEGYPAHQAWRAAKVHVAFDALDDDGIVRNELASRATYAAGF